MSTTVSDRSRRPLAQTPVTTVPAPSTANERCICNTNPCGRGGRLATLCANSTTALFSSLMPWPLCALTAKQGQSSQTLPATISSTSSCTSSRVSSSTKSHFVKTSNPGSTPNMVSTSKCSRVCCMMPSSHATTNKAALIPVAPATILRTKRSCPGTSTKPISVPSSSCISP